MSDLGNISFSDVSIVSKQLGFNELKTKSIPAIKINRFYDPNSWHKAKNKASQQAKQICAVYYKKPEIDKVKFKELIKNNIDRIQNRINCDALNHEEIKKIVSGLKDLGFIASDMVELIENILIMARHDVKPGQTKINWFGFTNRTNTLEQFIKYDVSKLDVENNNSLSQISSDSKLDFNMYIEPVARGLIHTYVGEVYSDKNQLRSGFVHVSSILQDKNNILLGKIKQNITETKINNSEAKEVAKAIVYDIVYVFIKYLSNHELGDETVTVQVNNLLEFLDSLKADSKNKYYQFLAEYKAINIKFNSKMICESIRKSKANQASADIAYDQAITSIVFSIDDTLTDQATEVNKFKMNGKNNLSQSLKLVVEGLLIHTYVGEVYENESHLQQGIDGIKATLSDDNFIQEKAYICQTYLSRKLPKLVAGKKIDGKDNKIAELKKYLCFDKMSEALKYEVELFLNIYNKLDKYESTHIPKKVEVLRGVENDFKRVLDNSSSNFFRFNIDSNSDKGFIPFENLPGIEEFKKSLRTLNTNDAVKEVFNAEVVSEFKELPLEMQMTIMAIPQGNSGDFGLIFNQFFVKNGKSQKKPSDDKKIIEKRYRMIHKPGVNETQITLITQFIKQRGNGSDKVIAEIEGSIWVDNEEVKKIMNAPKEEHSWPIKSYRLEHVFWRKDEFAEISAI